MIGQGRSFERDTVYREKSDLKANESDVIGIGQFGSIRTSQVTFVRGSIFFIKKGLGLWIHCILHQVVPLALPYV